MSFMKLIFVASMAVFFQQQAQGLTRAESAYAQQIADSFADSIQTAFVAGPGFSQLVSIPRDLLGKPYKLELSGGPAPSSTETGFVYVEWQGADGNASFSAPTITTSYSALTDADFVTEDSGRITLNPSVCQTVNMTNSFDSGGNDVIRIAKGCA